MRVIALVVFAVLFSVAVAEPDSVTRNALADFCRSFQVPHLLDRFLVAFYESLSFIITL